jgi:hypothetical protein
MDAADPQNPQSTRRSFESAAQCTLSGSTDAADNALLHVSVPYAVFTSNVLGPAELDNLMSQAREVKLRFNAADGSIVPEDSAAMPIIRIGEWDLFKDIAKVIPAMPKIRVKAGDSWEREKSLPLDTRHGDVTGHCVQSFRLDSILIGQDGTTSALVGWDFVYRLERHAARDGADTQAAGLLDRMPPGGTGAGQAVIKVDDKALERASMSFSAPSSGGGKFLISWKESISLHRVY